MPAPTTAEIDAFVTELLGPDATRSDRTAVTLLTTWACVSMRYDLDVEQVFDWDIINDFAVHLTETVSKGSAQHRRSQLRRIAKRVNPTYAPPFTPTSMPESTTIQAYTEAEVEQIEAGASYAFNARTNVTNKKMLVALCLGAGLRSTEASKLKWGQVFVDDLGVVLRDVNGRDVPVKDKYSTVLRENKGLFEAEDFVLSPDSKKADRSNVPAIITSLYVSDGLAPQVQRMRVTWIVSLLSDGVPEPLVCTTAGLTSLRRYLDQVRPISYDEDTMLSTGSWYRGYGSVVLPVSG
ncbi:hypothetical protein NQ011_09525 [Corynebacterium phoceense]|uniref:hypothetical protein n=1 Tax=Corynebacterium phoceense TaxID=1686286 RepID=UPI00211C1A52|nr:hypothetical protein [Corynebacterium phoceense]MCQ9336922.1 hypothetical protein [Corynebacterium phoceense]